MSARTLPPTPRRTRNHPRRWSRLSRGSVLVVVMVTLVFAAMALMTFMEKATNDLLVDHRDVLARRLRKEAYSALDVTLGVLEDFRAADNGLRSPAEGWGNPLEFAGYTPGEGRRIEIAFEDESGKISLPHANVEVLKALFTSWDIPQGDADELADALMGWMRPDHIYTTTVTPDYEQSALPFQAPARPLRSYAELAAIDKVREFFHDANGRPNEYWRRFVASVSLLDFKTTNLNGARPEALAAIGRFDPTQQQSLTDFRLGRGAFEAKGPGYFENAGQAAEIIGPGGDAAAFGTTISALRIIVTVFEGKSEFRVAAVVTWGNAAKTVRETAGAQRGQAAGAAQSAAQKQVAPNAGQQSAAAAQQAAARDLRYPFTLLEIRENDEIPAAPTPPDVTP